MQPTHEQQLIIDFARERSESLCVNALAGAAKTTTLCMIAEVLPKAPALALAFNTKIKAELERRLPPHIQCLTLNGLGHRAWAGVVRKRLTLSTTKTTSIVKQLLPKGTPWDEIETLRDLVASAKLVGLVPQGAERFCPRPQAPDSQELWERLADECDCEATPQTISLARQALLENIRLAYLGEIDFSDQIYMSVCFNGVFPRFGIILVDEAQDLSTMNHQQIFRTGPSARTFILGDRYQSIYAFRGAHQQSIDLLAEHYHAEELELSTTFRCDAAICDVVREHVPAITPRPNAGVGQVLRPKTWSLYDIPHGAAVLCRNNAPLLALASKCLQRGVPVYVAGKEVGKALKKHLVGIPAEATGQSLRDAITSVIASKLASASEPKRLRLADHQECLLALQEANPEANAEALSTIIGDLFADRSAIITLSTGHKAKGMEWDTVYHLDPHRIPQRSALVAAENGNPVPLQQERNLEYVINTRAKHRLVFVTTKGLKERTEDGK